MNPETGKFEELSRALEEDGSVKKAFENFERAFKEPDRSQLLRPNGEPVPDHWATFSVGERVVIKEHTFEVKYIGETAILFEPVAIPLIGEGEETG